MCPPGHCRVKLDVCFQNHLISQWTFPVVKDMDEFMAVTDAGKNLSIDGQFDWSLATPKSKGNLEPIHTFKVNIVFFTFFYFVPLTLVNLMITYDRLLSPHRCIAHRKFFRCSLLISKSKFLMNRAN